jgi:hypothetical protein
MPIRVFLKYGHTFDDEAIRVMGLAFVCARSALRIPINDPACPEIAKRIIELATTGERDSDKLCDFAIDGLRQPPAA